MAEQTTFNKVRIGQFFYEDGRLWQRVDRARDQLGAYNARRVGADRYKMFSPIHSVKAVPVGEARTWRV